MIGKKINELATELAPLSTDLTIIGDPTTGVSKKITLEQISSLFGGSVSFYTNLAGFPAVGNIDIIYCAKDTNKLYLWSGSAYTEIFPSQALLDTYQLRSEKGNANGYASLDSLGKVPISQLPSSLMEYKGMWNAATNTPTLANGTGDTGDVYICNVAGTVNFGAGNITFAVGDYVIYSGTIWQRSSGAVGTVTSVAATITGDSLTISGSPVTTSGTLAFAFNGTTAQYIRGNGTLATFPSLTGFVPYTGATTNVNLGTHSLSAYDLIINHTSGSGVAAQITKGGNGEALTVVKSSGSGNAASITGGVTLLDELHLNTDLADAYIASATNWNAAYNDKINSAAVTGTTTKTLTLTQQDGGTITASWTDDNTDAVTSVFGRTGAVVAVSGDYTTSLVTEGTNLYFTNARARAAISAGTGISYNSSTGVITNTITQYTDALARAAISLTTTGTSGAATYNNTTGVLNIPQYADQFVGTVTSVGLSAPTGFSVSGSPVTSSGTLALSFASGYSLPTTAKQTTWDTAYDRSLTAASVSGTTTKTLTLTKQDGSTLTASWTDDNTDAVTSVFGRTGAVVATSGDYTTAQVTESGNLYFTNARAIASTLTGYTSGAGTITSSDSILSAIQKLNGNIGALTTGVSSVNGLTGAVTLTTSNIAEGTNLYYTEARVNANTNVAANTAARHNAVTLGTANGLSLSTQVLSLGLASTSTTGALSSTDWNTFNNKTSNTGTVTSVGLSSATSGVTIGSTPITTSGTITLAIATASGSGQGLLSSTDWTTFNSKQNALTNPVTGTGTTNYLPKFTGASTIGNSIVQDNGSTISISTNSTVLSLDRTGAGTALIELKTNGTVRSYFGADASVPFIFFTQSASELMRLNASGNLSIGNTNDTYKLDVTGTLRTTGSITLGNGTSERIIAASSYIEMYNASTGDMTFFSGYSTAYINFCTENSSTPKLTIAPSGAAKFLSTLQVGTSQAIITPTNFGYSSSYKVLALGTGASNTNISINYDPSGNASGSFNGTGQILIAHNKGILAPNAANNDFIAVLRPIGTGVYFGGGMSSGEVLGNGLFISTTGAATFSSSVTATSFSVSNGSISNSGFWGMQNTAGAGSFADWALLNSATTRIMHNPTGTTNMVFNGTVTATKGFFSSNAAADSTTALLANASTNDSTTYAAIFGSLNAGYRMVVRADGNVGIGTASPGNFSGVSFASPILDLVGTFNIRGRAADGVALFNMGGETYRKATLFTSIQDADPYLAFAVGTSGTSSNGTERMRITSGGEACIGRTTAYGAGFLLNVQGNIYASAGIVTGAPSGESSATWKLGDTRTGTCVPSTWGDFSSWFTGTVANIEINGTTYTIPVVNAGYC
jgi:hypothetical protein